MIMDISEVQTHDSVCKASDRSPEKPRGFVIHILGERFVPENDVGKTAAPVPREQLDDSSAEVRYGHFRAVFVFECVKRRFFRIYRRFEVGFFDSGEQLFHA